MKYKDHNRHYRRYIVSCKYIGFYFTNHVRIYADQGTNISTKFSEWLLTDNGSTKAEFSPDELEEIYICTTFGKNDTIWKKYNEIEGMINDV